MSRLILNVRQKWHDSLVNQAVLESNEMKHQTAKQNVPHSALHIWVMTFICMGLILLAATTAARLPYYWTTGDILRLAGTILFNLLALLGLADNVHTHILFWQNQQANQPEIAVQS